MVCSYLRVVYYCEDGMSTVKVYLVMEAEHYGCSYPLKIFKSGEKAQEFEELCREDDEEGINTYYTREIEADLNE